MRTQALSILIRVAGVLLSVGQTVILARMLGPQDLGIYSAVLVFTTLLAIPAAAGLPEFLTREVARARESGNVGSARTFIVRANHLAILISSGAIPVLIGLYLIGLLEGATPAALVAGCLMIPLLSADLIRAGAMRGMGSALLSQIPENILRPGVFLAAVLVMMTRGQTPSVDEALWAFVVAAIISAVFGQMALWRLFRGVRSSPNGLRLRNVMRQSFGVAALGATQTLMANIDIAILSIFGLYVAAGQYRVALLGVVALLFLYNALSAVAVRDLSISLARGDSRETMRVSDRLTLWGSAATLCILLLYVVFGQKAIATIFGMEFEAAYGVLIILATGHFVAIAAGPSLEIVNLLRSQRRAVMINLVGVALMLIVSLSLIRWDPLWAVAMGSASSNMVRRLLMAKDVSERLSFDLSVIGALRRR